MYFRIDVFMKRRNVQVFISFSSHKYAMKVLNSTCPRATAQVGSHRLLIAEAQVHFQGSLCGICGGLRDTGSGFPLRSSVFPSQYHSAAAPCHLGVDIRPASGRIFITS